MASNFSTTMIEYPFSLEWEIAENRLQTLKDSTDDECLESNTVTVVHASNFQYYLQLFPNGVDDESRGITWIFLQIELGNEEKIEAEWTFSIKSANWTDKINYGIDKNWGWGSTCCSVDEFFDSNKKFIADGKLALKVEGIFKIESAKSNKETVPTFRDLWKIGYEDFTIIAGGNEIQVHKNVLAYNSKVFDAMFSNSKFKEGSENRLEIIDFPFEIVEKAIHLCYQQKNVSTFSTEENASLLKFADKYDISQIKKNLEVHLSEQITVSNLYEMVKIAEEGNALKLRMKCLDFFVICLLKKEFVPNMKLLDSEFFATAIETFSSQKTQTL